MTGVQTCALPIFDVRLGIAEYLSSVLGPTFTTPEFLRDKVADGKLGKKTGEGFYQWSRRREEAIDNGARGCRRSTSLVPSSTPAVPGSFVAGFQRFGQRADGQVEQAGRHSSAAALMTESSNTAVNAGACRVRYVRHASRSMPALMSSMTSTRSFCRGDLSFR